MAPRIHDADLCERIRKLEERVRELEARPPYTITYPPVWVYPYWTTPERWPAYPWTVTSAPQVTIGGTADVSGVSTTYTALND